MTVNTFFIIRSLNTWGGKVFYLMNESAFHLEDVAGWVTEAVESAVRFDGEVEAFNYLTKWYQAKPGSNSHFEIVKVFVVDGKSIEPPILLEQKSPLQMALMVYRAHCNVLPAHPDGERIHRSTAIDCALVTVRFTSAHDRPAVAGYWHGVMDLLVQWRDSPDAVIRDENGVAV